MITYIFSQLLRGFVLLILCYVVLVNGTRILKMIAALFFTSVKGAGNRKIIPVRTGESKNFIPVSLLVPVYNGEDTIIESIKTMLNLNYVNYEIVVINDGSTDGTFRKLINTFDLHKISYPVRERLAVKRVRGIYCNPDIPRLKLIDKENGGKSDALNAGVNLSLYPFIVTVDADTLLEPDSLLRIALAFMRSKYTIALGGTTRIGNGCTVKAGKILDVRLPRNIWALFQVIEYLRSCLSGRIGWKGIDFRLIRTGAYNAYQKETIFNVGGFSAGTAGEDIDMVIKLHRYMISKKLRHQIDFLPDPVCWKRVPENLEELSRQRRRRQIGFMDVLGRNRDMFMNPRYGLLGLLAIPFYFLYEFVSPIIELSGYLLVPLAWYLGLLSLDAMILFFAAAFLFGIVTSLGTLIAEEFTNTKYLSVGDVTLLAILSIPENLFYRQMTAFFRLMGIFGYRKHKS